MHKYLYTSLFAAAVFLLAFLTGPVKADDVIITPIGQKTGEFCRADRAMIFEDPTGTRVLYDPGRTVAGGLDPRLGAIDLMLLSGVHSDHIGVGRTTQDPDDPDGTCGANPPLAPTPNSNFAEIVATTGATVFAGGEMRDYLRTKVVAEGGSASQVDVLRHGAKRTLGGVTVAVVTAHHSNGVPRDILDEGLAASLAPDGLTAYVGPENGFVLTFSNGLVVYLSGDTGHTADMGAIVRDFYEASVVVVNMGDIFSMGPEEAAFAVNKLLKPKTAIPSHANQASTIGGVVVAGTRLETFSNLVSHSVDVIVPLSGVEITCNGAGVCNQ